LRYGAAGVAVLVAGCLLAAAGCGGDETSDISTGGPVLGEIPWQDSERAVYRVLDGDEEIGSAGLSIGCNSASGAFPGFPGTCLFVQTFEFSDRGITDEVLAVADAATLEPRRVTRTVDGPDGKRTWEATYGGSAVTVEQRDENDDRTDELDVPQDHNDTWTDLFLWRTLDLSEGYEGKYMGVVTADFSKPDVITIALKVTGLEEVSVPAGTFSAWRLEIRSGGRTQKAWIADNPQRTLLRYDNTEIVFELE
jgi:hypothetical protein